MTDSVARVAAASPRATSQYRGTLLTPTVAGFCAVAALLWVVTIVWARGMGNMPGTMGMSIGSFVLMWALMMAAMMLPSVAPMALLYSRTTTVHRTRRMTAFAAGYLAAWVATGLVAYGLARAAGDLAANAPSAARAGSVVVFAGVGIYQLTPLKERCLTHCRSPIGHMFHYASWGGRTRDVRAGAHHGLFCLGCCWALMVLMVAFGVMNVGAMVGLALVVAAEKLWRHGPILARLAGVASIGLAMLVIVEPGIAPGLDPDRLMDMTMSGPMRSG